MKGSPTKILVPVTILALLIALPALTSAQAQPVVLTVATTQNTVQFNPDWQPDAGAYFPAAALYSRLVTLDFGIATGHPVYGDLAKSWDVSSDGLTYTFHLNSNATWSDGQAITSQDVKYTFDTIMQKKYPGNSYVLKNMASSSAPDNETFVAVLSQATPGFISLLAMAGNWYLSILPMHVFQGTDWSTNPQNTNPTVTSGPFKLQGWVKSDHVAFVPNPQYYHGAPKIDQLVLKYISDSTVGMTAFLSGEISYVDYNYLSTYAQVPIVNRTAGIHVETIPSFYDENLFFNLNKAPFNNKQVREAIAYAVDRNEVSEKGFLGYFKPQYTPSWLALGDYANPNAVFPDHNLDKANQLLDQAGYPKGADGTRFTVHFYNSPSGEDVAVGDVVTEQLKAVGINVIRDQFDYSTWYSKMTSRDFELSVYWISYGPTPDNAYNSYFSIGGTRNLMNYSNPEVSALLADAGHQVDMQKRISDYKQVQQLIVNDIPYIPIVHETYFYFVHDGWQGLPQQPTGYGKAQTWFGYAGAYFVSPTTQTQTQTETTTSTSNTAYLGAAAIVIIIAAIAFLAVRRKSKK